MKKILAVLMLAIMLFSLCACGDIADVTTAPQNETDPTDPITTAPEPTETEPEATGINYTIKVVDEGGNPVAGVKVQMCDAAGSCKVPKTTDENGTVVYENQTEAEYKAQITELPEGYQELGEEKAYYPFKGDSTEVTITIKAIG